MTHPRVSHEEWLARFDGYLHQQGYRARTIRRYHTVCQQFLQYLDAQAIALEQVDPVTLAAYVQFRSQRYLRQHGRVPHAAHRLFNRGITCCGLHYLSGRLAIEYPSRPIPDVDSGSIHNRGNYR